MQFKLFVGLLVLIILIFITCHFLTNDKPSREVPPPQSQTERSPHKGEGVQPPHTPPQHPKPAVAPVVVDEAGPGIITICTPGATRLCRCADGQEGKQVCSADGSFWLDCECEAAAEPIEEGPGAGMDCAPGERQTCYCNDGSPGIQECTLDGEWTDCDCQDPETPKLKEDPGPIENPQPY